ncbi:MAG TPA: hypothetical protein P5513_07120 [Candidatus Diapherotrites archaeon]|nr:hypothetical protein [Candidatus Diapherotrites archaeon]
MITDVITLKENIKTLSQLQKETKKISKSLCRIDIPIASDLQKQVEDNRKVLRLMHVVYSMKKGRAYKEIEPHAKTYFDTKRLKRLVSKVKDKPVQESSSL